MSKRSSDSHKWDYGHVLILAGSKRYVGAGCLSSMACLRAGAGLVTLGVPEGLHAVFATKLTEVMTLPLPQTDSGFLSETAYQEIMDFSRKVNVLLIGPGLSQEGSTQQLVRRLVERVDLPLVIDADGLNAVAEHLDLLASRKKATILTPHHKEMARLVGCELSAIQKDRKKVAKDFALRYNTILALKGYRTVVADPRGVTYVNLNGNPGMATAGSGDVLAGIIAGFVGQGLTAFEATRTAVYVQGLAGDLAAQQKTQTCLIASDIIDFLPAAFKKMGKTPK